MNLLNKISGFLEKNLSPIANKMGQNKVLKSVGAGAMGTLPVTLGVMILAIVSKFPFQPWLDFLTNTGMADHFSALLQVTTGLLAIYFSVLIAYHYTTMSNQRGINGSIISMASFFILMPLTVSNSDGVVISGLEIDYLGSEGLFVAMIVAILTSMLYVHMMNKNIKIKLPDSVPTMVSDSLSPAIVSTTILTIVFIIRVALSYTSYHDVFTLVSTLVSEPIMNVGANPVAVIIVYTFAGICWFFGIHPTAITSAFLPVMIMTSQANIAAYLAGESMPYVVTKICIDCMLIGGAGNTLGLAISMLFAKSSRFKALGKLSVIPSFFNINEPLIFGTPIILNPLFFFPMVFGPLVNGVLVMVLCKLGLAFSYNPTIATAASTPKFFNGLFMGGFPLLLLYVIVAVVDLLLWLPFFKLADKQAYEEENRKVESLNEI